MHKQLKKAIDLSRKTGDRLIVYDMNQDDSTFVVMNLDEYEKLVIPVKIHDLTEDELLDKINRDIASWKSEQFDGKTDIKITDKELERGNDEFDAIRDFTGKFDENYQILEEKVEKSKRNSQWKIPNEIKENAEEVIEEDRQYLEEV